MVDSLEVTKIFSAKNVALVAAVILIAALAVYFRTTMLHYYGFYEPDGFYYYSVMRATVDNGFTIPQYLNTSGYPYPTLVAEAHGVYWVSLVPYSILQYAGVSYYTVMRLMPVVFALLDMLGAYLLMRYLSKDKMLGLLAALFVALSMGNAARTSALIYRGDTFVTFFLLIALALFIEVFRQDNPRRKLAMAFAAAAALAMSNAVWNGAPFADATFMLAFAMVMLYSFAMRKEKVIAEGYFILISIAVWWVLATIATATGFIQGQQLVGINEFVPVFSALIVMWAVLYAISSNTPRLEAFSRLMRTPYLRVGLLAAGLIIGLLAFYLIFPRFVYHIFVDNGFNISGSYNPVGQSTQELQPPNFPFLFTSFSTASFASLPVLMLMASFYFGFNGIWTSAYGIGGMVMTLMALTPYLLMQVYDSGGVFGGKARIRLDLNIPMVVIMAYSLLTIYLQSQIIRFNSLVSLPIAMLAAYTLYWLISYASRLQSASLRLAGMAFMSVIIVVVIAGLVYYAYAYSQGLVQADSINPQFISALQWLGRNSPSNSSVLTLWPDGSVVEGVANRKTVTDSVGSENGTKAYLFASWLFNNTPDGNFMYSYATGKPTYLLVRNSWLIETQGIYTESELKTNESLYGFSPIYSYTESAVNSTTRQLVLRNSNSYPYAVVSMTYSNTTNSLSAITANLQVGPSQSIPFTWAAFYNQDNGNYTLIPQGSANNTNGAMLLVQYSSVPRPGMFINLTGAYIVAAGLAQSNMFKFLYFCNNYSCEWNNKQVSAKLAYMNSDTKIFKLVYNTTT
jgi:asparagine N-glycosylation enzyme membrane subunit Stt3